MDVLTHRRPLLQKYAKAQLQSKFPSICKFLVELKAFVKPDARKSGKFCLICFIEEVEKLEIASVETKSLSDEQIREHVEKIKNAFKTSYGAS